MQNVEFLEYESTQQPKRLRHSVEPRLEPDRYFKTIFGAGPAQHKIKSARSYLRRHPCLL